MAQLFHLIVYVPVAHAEAVREAMARAGAGEIGNYDSCSFSCRGTGRFQPNAQANPTIGEVGKLEEVEEERIETVVEKTKLSSVLRAIKDAHPYEEPAMHLLKMEDYKDFL